MPPVPATEPAAPAPVAAPTHAGWGLAGVALGVALLALGAIYASTHQAFWNLWNNSDSYGHGLFIVPISLYAVWLLRGHLRAAAPRLWPPGLVAVAGFSVAWGLARVLGIDVGEQLAVAGLIGALVLTLTGWRITWLLGFPIAYLLLAVPVWDLLVRPLQYQTAEVSTWVLQRFGVPVYLEDIYLAIPSGSFVIAEVCAGLRYLMAMASIGAFYGFLNGLTVAGGVVFFLISLAWAVFFNWVRVVGIIAIGHVSDMQHSIVHDHYTFGWILFAVALLPLFWIGRFFPQRPERAPRLDPRPGAGKAATLVVLVLAVLALALGPVSAARLLALQPAGPFVLAWPDELPGWQKLPGAAEAPGGAGANSATWRPAFPGAAWEGLTAYGERDAASGAAPVLAYAAVYGRQSQGAELINATNALFDRERWSIHRSGSAFDVPAVPVLGELLLRDERGALRLVWFTYRAGGAFHVSGLRTKLAQLRDLLDGRPAGAVLALAVEVGNDLEGARARLRTASAALLPAMVAELATQDIG